MRFARSLALAALVSALLAPAARAQSLNQLGIARLNEDAQVLWQNDGLPMARQAALAELQKLVNVPHDVAGATVKIIAVNYVTLDCPKAPGLTKLDGSGIAGRLPLQGAWRVNANVRVNAKGKVLFIPFDDTFNVEVEINSLVASVRADLDSSDPAAPRISRVYPPQVSFAMKLTSANAVVKFLNWLTPSVFNPLANTLARVGATYLAQKMNLMVRSTPQIVGAQAAPVVPVSTAIGLEAAAVKIQKQIHDTKLPFGTIFEMRYRDDFLGTWEESLVNPNFPLVPKGYESIFDSTTNTGEYLAALSYRYAVTRSASTLQEIRELLQATRILFTMKGEPGNLNRLIMPLSEYTAHFGPPAGDKYAIHFQGTDYVASDYISRDCYFGMMYGLSTCYDMVSDPQIKDEIRQQIEMGIDYLLRNNWTWRNRSGGFGERWAGALEQQYAWLLAAERVNPAKYGAVRDQYKGFTDLLWSGMWIAVMDPYYSYYKFELGGASLSVVLRLETDPVRWMRSYQGMAILQRFLGHHQNAFFNCFYFAANPALKPSLGAENAALLTHYLKRPRRKITVAVTDPSIETIDYTLPLDPNLLYPGGSQAPTTIKIAKRPIPIEKRVMAGFLWSVSPCQLTPGYPVNPKPDAEGESYDFLLPYWISRYYGAIPAPRTPVGGTSATEPAAATTSAQ